MSAGGHIELTLEAFLRTFLVLVAAAILAGAVFLMLAMDASSRSQGGRVYVAVAAVVLLGAVDTQFARLERRRWGLFDSAASSRFGLRSLLLILASAALLVGLALLLP